MGTIATKPRIVTRPLIPIEIRLKRKLVEMPSGCIEFVGYRSSKGYGKMSVVGKWKRTHRVAWELANGPIPEDMFVLHRCDNPPCCNVDHLFLGTIADNNADMIAKGRHGNEAKTHCIKGHPFDETNTYIPRDGRRRCRICQRARDAHKCRICKHAYQTRRRQSLKQY